ncbi:MAG: glycogen debranching protein GlgX, partial [Acidimicrobiia bacterium]|nr:glycogen debranching protein GlgX [Acidimicrobiia bacterium]
MPASARPVSVWPGQPYPLGATYDGTGTNFSVYSFVADAVELCLFDDDGNESRIELPEQTAHCFHGYLPNVGPGQRYGCRVQGPWAPNEGHRCNPRKLLLDPYAKAIEGVVTWSPAVYPYKVGDPGEDLAASDDDSAPYVPRSVVTNPYFDWSDDRPPRVGWHDTVIYEAHVKGVTARHADVPPEQRGTYAALWSPPVVEHLKRLGVTAIEVMPVHQFIHDERLVRLGLRNYWGYNSIGYFAPHNDYSSTGERGEQVQEFKQMVKQLHASGIEVILDVVYNHTAEGNHLGPVLAFKGFDNASYYRLSPEEPRYYVDYTGTGNSLNMRNPYVLQLIMDSLRYWITEMHVDGFRFDLAATLARELHDVDRLSAFFDIIQQDPVIREAKLIAEPWDVGEGGYQVGNFPPLWSEWNGKFRDTVRDFWRAEPGTLGELGYRLTGSADLYETSGRRPYNSVNFVTAHDGFTLRDLVSYNEKHNRPNGEDNEDGESFNRSWNCGVEGPTDDADVLDRRARQQRNFLATLLLSQGVAMLRGGDELGQTKNGNNNTYCQDNELTWLNWELNAEQAAFLDFVRRVARLSLEQPVFQRRKFFHGRKIRGTEVKDVTWYDPSGEEMPDSAWDAGFVRCLGVRWAGDVIPE